MITAVPYIEAPTATYLREYWRMIRAVRNHYPLFQIPGVRFSEEGIVPVIVDTDTGMLIINYKFRSDPRPHLRRGIIDLVTLHITGEILNPRYKLYRRLFKILTEES